MQMIMEELVALPADQTSGQALADIYTDQLMRSLMRNPNLAWYLVDTDLYHYACLAYARRRGLEPVEFEDKFRGKLTTASPVEQACRSCELLHQPDDEKGW